MTAWFTDQPIVPALVRLLRSLTEPGQQQQIGRDLHSGATNQPFQINIVAWQLAPWEAFPSI